jgi:hypothetical protein
MSVALPVIIGHQIAKSGRGDTRHAYYRRSHTRYTSRSKYRPAPQVYYGERGNRVTPAYDGHH